MVYNIILADFALKYNDFEELSLQYWDFYFSWMFFFVTGYTYNDNYE